MGRVITWGVAVGLVLGTAGTVAAQAAPSMTPEQQLEQAGEQNLRLRKALLGCEQRSLQMEETALGLQKKVKELEAKTPAKGPSSTLDKPAAKPSK